MNTPRKRRHKFAFAIEFHLRGGCCWVQSHSMRGYRYRGDAHHTCNGYVIGRDAVHAYAYGKFRHFVDIFEQRTDVRFDFADDPVWRLFDGVRLVEIVDGRTVELARWLNPAARTNVSRA